MTSKPLSASPLHFLAHRFTRIEVVASEQDEPDGGMGLSTRRQFATHEDDPRKWLVTLDLDFGQDDGEGSPPYSGRLTIEGEFRVANAYPEENMKMLIEVTGTSILFGACREMLANLTARSSHGMISLPSVSFLEPPKKKTARKKSAPKKSTKKKK